VRESWPKLIDAVLRPARPRLEGCLRAREQQLVARRLVAEEQAQALANCRARIESARALVLAADDGLVSSRMTDLEREWRSLSRSDPDAGLMDLWARIAPPSWIDRKPWHESPPAQRLDLAVALAADWPGVAAAEAAITLLRGALAAWGTAIGARIRWRSLEKDCDLSRELLVEPLRAARNELAARGQEALAFERARRVETEVHEAAHARFSERPLLARTLAHAAFVDCLLHAASLDARPNPVTALRDLWATGYLLSAIDETGVTVEVAGL
jgi:hypothetical protein